MVILSMKNFMHFCYRSANYYVKTGMCELSDMDRVTLAGTSAFAPSEGKSIIN